MASDNLMGAVSSYEKFIEQHSIEEPVLDAYIEACKVAIHTERDVEYGLQCTKRSKELIERFCMEKTGGTIWDLEKFAFENKTEYELIDKFYEPTLLEAQNQQVESYFRYLEKKRDPKERFYMPKRNQFLNIGLPQALQGMINDDYDILCISLPPGSGKAQPIYSKVLTPNGFINMGDVKAGTKVIAGNGEVSNVTGVYPQGIRDIYEITLDDGSKCRCSDNHLWTVQTIEDRRDKKHRTIKTTDMIKNLWRGRQRNYSISYVPNLEMNKKPKINPYLLGFLLGDGCFKTKNICFATSDNDIVEKLKKLLPNSHSIVQDAKYNYRIRSNSGGGPGNKGVLRILLEEEGLFGRSSINKFIPKKYLYSSHEDRIELLRGLLDSDGDIAKNGYAISYTSKSKRLAYDVRELVHSLGGYASIAVNNSSYKDKNGKIVDCGIVYRVTIQFNHGKENPFYTKRKSDRFVGKKKTKERFIDKIEYVGKELCQCIMIDNPCHQYITDDYIVTHNTTIEKFFVSGVIGWYPKDFNLFYSHSGDITRMFYDGVYDIVTNSDEYTWYDIFPDLRVTSTNAKMEQFNLGRYKPFPSLQCTSVGSKNAGKVRASKYLMVDDMIGGIEEAMNPMILDKLWDKYAVDARQRKIQDTSGKNCKEIHIATRWSVRDVIGRLQTMYEGNPRVKVIAVPDVDPVTGKSNFNYEYGGFTEEFFADQQLLMDEISYRCLYKQDPIEREGLLFPDDKIRRYLNLPHGEPEIITAQCDTKGKGTDYFVLPVLQKYGENYYCVDAVCDNTADYEMQYRNAANVLVNNKVQECEFERNAGGDRVAMEVNKRVEAVGWICNITDEPTETNKEARIFQCSNWILQHVIFKDQSLYKPNEPYGVMMSLLKQYSVSGKKQLDDVPDVFSNFALRMTKGNRVAKVEAVSNPFRRY